MNLNKVMIIGRLGRKPEVNYIKPDVAIARFSVATSESYKSKEGDWIETTEWHNIVAWRNSAKYAETMLDKGTLVYIEGKLQTRKWDTAEGVTKYSTEIVAEQIKILEKRANSASQESSTQVKEGGFQQTAPAAAVVNEDANPFGDVSPELNAESDDDLPF